MQKQDKSRSERFELVSGPCESTDNFQAWTKSLFHLLTSPFGKPIRDLSVTLSEGKREAGRKKKKHDTWHSSYRILPPKKLQDRWCGHLEIVCQLSAWVDLAKKKKIQTGRWLISSLLKKRRARKERTAVFDNKETFCLPFAAPVKSATNKEIHYETLLKKVWPILVQAIRD